ncbi:MAG TPA: HAD family hydrolase [Candidatus Baltobacteraceae bacterium]|nr:HAD family hydrolase [Candidatus Baltobacteraceae bacterium]
MDPAERFRAGRKRSRPALRKIAAVGFDFDHTLGIDNKLERVVFLRLLDAACEQGGHCIGTLADEIVRIDDLLVKQRSGAFTIEEAVQNFIRERGIAQPDAYVDEYKRMAVEMVPSFVIPEPGVHQLLEALARRGVPCAILTNGWSPLQQHKAQRVQFSGPVLVSSDIGIQKPEPRAFEMLVQTLGTRPEETAFVGDTPSSDVVGAIRAGMQGVWFDAEGTSYPADMPSPTATIHTLPELLALVER